MSTEVFAAKFGAKLAELARLCGASLVGDKGGFRRENRNVRRIGTSEVSTTRRLSAKLNNVLDLSDYTWTISVLSNACIA